MQAILGNKYEWTEKSCVEKTPIRCEPLCVCVRVCANMYYCEPNISFSFEDNVVVGVDVWCFYLIFLSYLTHSRKYHRNIQWSYSWFAHTFIAYIMAIWLAGWHPFHEQTQQSKCQFPFFIVFFSFYLWCTYNRTKDKEIEWVSEWMKRER